MMKLCLTINKKAEYTDNKKWICVGEVYFVEYDETGRFRQNFRRQVDCGLNKRDKLQEDQIVYLNENDYRNCRYYTTQAAIEHFRKLNIFGTFVLLSQKEEDDKWVLEYSFVNSTDMIVVENE